MTKYELSLTRDYVPDWTLVDAMRELFQNALDQETVAADNKMFWEYHEDVQSFHIGNKLSVLEPKSLLLGATSKADDKNTIGKFGEGYKIATLVLTRMGKKVTFFNYGAREVWRARFSKSRKYGAEILVFEVDKKFPWAAVPDNNLTIVVEGITKEESIEVSNSNLHMREGYKYWQSAKGRILRDEGLKGKMFVNGLYITTVDDFHYGYDFKPEHITLDRDRRLIHDFDLKWTTSQIWAGFQDGDDEWDYDAIDRASHLVSVGAPDVAYLKSANQWNIESNKYDAVAEHVYESFKIEHGESAVPVSSQQELETVPSTHKPIVVNEGYKEVITSSPEYIAPDPIVEKSLSEEVNEWIKKHAEDLPYEAIFELVNIIDKFERGNS